MAIPMAIRGRVFYQAGSWGTELPMRSAGRATAWLMDNKGPVLFASANIDQDGFFIITFNPPAAFVTDFYIEVHDTCLDEKHMHRINRPPDPKSNFILPDDIGNITVPWEPADAELAYVNSTFFKDTQLLAKNLSALLRSPQYPISMALIRESADGTGKDYTPAQLLLIPLKVEQPGFLKHLVEDIQDEIVSVRADTINELAIGILERFSKADIKMLEDGRIVNRLLAAIQRAYPGRHSYSESLMKEPAHDMAAACVILFLAAIMKKDKVQPNITFRSSSYVCAGGQGKRTFSRVSIFVSKA